MSIVQIPSAVQFTALWTNQNFYKIGISIALEVIVCFPISRKLPFDYCTDLSNIRPMFLFHYQLHTIALDSRINLLDKFFVCSECLTNIHSDVAFADVL